MTWLCRHAGVDVFVANNDGKKASDIAWLYQDVKSYLRNAEALLKAMKPGATNTASASEMSKTATATNVGEDASDSRFVAAPAAPAAAAANDAGSEDEDLVIGMINSAANEGDEGGGVDLEIRDADGNSLLLLSCLHGRERVLDALLQRGGLDLHDRNKRGMTAVHCASRGGNLAMLQRLVEREGLHYCLQARDLRGWTLLHWACHHPFKSTSGDDCYSNNNNNTEEVIAWLLHQGLDPLDADSSGKTPFHIAVDSLDKDAIRILVVKLVLHLKSAR